MSDMTHCITVKVGDTQLVVHTISIDVGRNIDFTVQSLDGPPSFEVLTRKNPDIEIVSPWFHGKARVLRRDVEPRGNECYVLGALHSVKVDGIMTEVNSRQGIDIIVGNVRLVTYRVLIDDTGRIYFTTRVSMPLIGKHVNIEALIRKCPNIEIVSPWFNAKICVLNLNHTGYYGEECQVTAKLITAEHPQGE